MEQIIFLHNDEAAWDVLRQVQQSSARRIVLVIPAHLERLRLNMVLRLIWRQTAEQSQRLIVVSEDRLVQVLAERIGCMVATTLDEYHGLLPGQVASLTKGARRFRAASRMLHPLHQDALGFPAEKAAPAASTFPKGTRLQPLAETPGTERPPLTHAGPSERPAQGEPGKPGVNLDTMLVGGYLPNPGATPALDEADELADQDAAQWLSYEIADENHPNQAQREAEAHEAHITARIRQTSATSPEVASSAATLPETGPTQTPEQVSPDARPPQGGRLRPMPGIDELIQERGRADLFAWFTEHAAAPTTDQPASEGQPQAPTSEAASSAGAAAKGRRPERPDQSAPTRARFLPRRPVIQTPLRRHSQRPAWAHLLLWRRIGVAGILLLSLSMTCFGLSLLPSAQVSYHVAIESYSETLALDAQPGTQNRPGAEAPGTFVPAVVAQFDGVLIAQAPATGYQQSAGGVSQLAATQRDLDQATSVLDARLRSLGQTALLAQLHPGDVPGLALANEQVEAFPNVGTPLPEGSSTFQVSLALHLREMVVRQQTLQQTVWARMNKDIAAFKHGFTLAAGQQLALNVVTSATAGTGTDLPALRLIIQAAGRIMPALTPDQARAAIAGMSVEDAERYLSHQPGISGIAIDVLPKWLNRLPIFSARIRIKLES